MRGIREAVRAGVEGAKVLAGCFRASLRGSGRTWLRWGAIAVGVVLIGGKLGSCAGEWFAGRDEREFNADRIKVAIADAELWRTKYWAQRERSDSIEFVNQQLAELGRAARVVADTHEVRAGRGKRQLVVDSTLADSVTTLLGVVEDQDAALLAKDVRIRSDSLRIIILTADRDAWKQTADSAALVFADFKAGLVKELRKHDCSIDPFGVVGCPSRKAALAIGGVGGFVAGVAATVAVRSVVKPRV